MKLETWAGVGIFALIMTVMAMVAAGSLALLFFPPEFHDLVFSRSLEITALIAFPLCILVGNKIKLNTELANELRRLVHRDRLTNVATRDFFFRELAKNSQTSGVCLMIDIDHFKSVNDTYGHLVGDKVIAHTAKLIERQVGPRDIVCRFGGEEFVVFLENCTDTQTLKVAERIRATLESSPLDNNGTTIAVTVSIGASLRTQAHDIDEAIRHADDALYKAKALGRNRCEVAEWSRPGLLSEPRQMPPSPHFQSA